MKTREKGEKYRPVVEVLDVKEGELTVIKVSGHEFVDATEFRKFKRMYAETARKLHNIEKRWKELKRELNEMGKGK